MSRVIVLLSIVGCLTTLSYAQYAEDAPRPFEVYGLASGLKTVDATGTLVVVNPGRNSPLGFSFFGEGLAGVYRWNVSSGNVNFTTDKGIVLAGGGMDIRLTQRLVWRVFEFQIGLAGARNGPLSTSGPSTGIAYRFGGR